MTLAQCLALWFSTYANVFPLGFQSRNVNSGRYAMAASTSFLITVAQLVFVREAACNDTVLFLALTGTAGPAGICTAICISQRLHKTKG